MGRSSPNDARPERVERLAEAISFLSGMIRNDTENTLTTAMDLAKFMGILTSRKWGCGVCRYIHSNMFMWIMHLSGEHPKEYDEWLTAIVLKEGYSLND